jgi:hypothetical protein
MTSRDEPNMSVVDETMCDPTTTHNNDDNNHNTRNNILHRNHILEPTQDNNNNNKSTGSNNEVEKQFDLNDNDTTDDTNDNNINHMIDDTLQEIDYEIIHSEEKELMNKYYHIIHTNIQYDRRRGRHLILQSYPLQSTNKLETNELTIEDSTIDSRTRYDSTKSNSKNKKRPRLQLYDYDIGTIGYIKNSYQHIDLQLIRTTILIPRFFTKKVSNQNTVKNCNDTTTTTSTGTSTTGTIRMEQCKKECEQYLYMKFYKLCIHHTLKYTLPIYWKYFNISLQSANPNSWRCIVVGYKPMVQDVLLYLQHRVRPMKTK